MSNQFNEEIEKGDVVKVISDDYWSTSKFKKGSVLFVSEVELGNSIFLCYPEGNNKSLIDSQDGALHFRKNELELLCKAPKFKKGDIVKCVIGDEYDHGEYEYPVKNKMYEILDLQYDEEMNEFYVRIFDHGDWSASRFVPVGFNNTSEKRSQDAESNDEEDCITDTEYRPEDENIFQIGLSDTVKVWWGVQRGKTGVIIAEDGDEYFNVKFSDGYTNWYPVEYLDLVEKYNGITEKPLETLQNALGGIKHDQGKIRYTLLLQDLPRAVKEVTEVLEFGAKKYQRLNFEKVESNRYDEAMCRHLMEYLKGDVKDSESGKHHLSHLVCCAMFLIERHLKEHGED